MKWPFLLRKQIQEFPLAARNLGFWNAWPYSYRRLGENLGLWPARPKSYALHSRHAAHPLLCRPNSSDVHVFRQIFVKREYSCLDDVVANGLIIDCGANVGYSSAYFLTRYPRATVVAVEPDHASFAMLKQNLSPYGSRTKSVEAAVWSRATGLVFSRETLGKGQEWAREVRECAGDEKPDFSAVDVGTLLAQTGFDHIDILKIDVEKAEAAIFSSNYESWIHRVDNLVIELHGEQCSRIFHDAIRPVGFELSRCGELTVCKKRSHVPRKAPQPSAVRSDRAGAPGAWADQ